MNKKLTIGIILVVIGIGLFFVPKSEPNYECAEPGAPYSGFIEGDCNLTDADYEKYVDSQGASPFVAIGLGVVVLGLIIAALSFKKPKA